MRLFKYVIHESVELILIKLPIQGPKAKLLGVFSFGSYL